MGTNSGKLSLLTRFDQFLTSAGIKLRAKLIIIFLVIQVVPLVLLTYTAWKQLDSLGGILRDIAVEDSSDALNDSAVENIERMSTDTAQKVASFLYGRDDDILYLASIDPSLENFAAFAENKTGLVVDQGEWVLSEDGTSWAQVNPPEPAKSGGVSTNQENEDMDGYHYRDPETYTYSKVPLYDEITFVGLDGREILKYVSPNSTKTAYPMSTENRDVSQSENTYVKAEHYFEALQDMEPGEIYVSDVIGAYVGSNFIGMYTPDNVENAAADRGYDIQFNPESQAYAGLENPNGQRFEGIVRWATPVAGSDGSVIGYVTFALNHQHIMEFVDHITPMNERYTQLPSAFEGNYAFIWDYNCRNISHPRHHSIVGYDPETGQPQVPWLESSIYEGWQESGLENWADYIANYPTFFEQSRTKKPAAELTQAGLVGLDGRYLNNAPQCTGWMDLTIKGGSGSFYILWSGIYKLNTAAAIPYYTGQYAPSVDNGFSRRGFGFVAIGSGLEDFTAPATEMEGRLVDAISESQGDSTRRLVLTTVALIVVVVMIAILIAMSITGRINKLIEGISRFRSGERQFRYNEPVKDEFGALADSFDDMADSIVDSVKNSLVITDINKRVIYMNDAALEFCRASQGEVVGELYSTRSIYPGGSKYDPILAMEEGREAEVIYVEELDRYIKGVANYFEDSGGSRVGYIIESVDMTEMIREQIRIETQKSLLDMVFASSPDLIWYMDDEGRYITVNPRFASIVGKPAEEFVGKDAFGILPEALARGFSANDLKAIQAGAPLYSEELVVFADGHEEILDSVRTLIYAPNGERIGLLGFARDVTIRVKTGEQLQRTQLELERAVEEANQANAHKGDFLARMSHEIRTPMNAIIGLAAIIEKKLTEMDSDGEEVATIRDHIDKIETSSQHLLGLLNDILDLSKIEAGKIELSSETIELGKLLETVDSIIRPRCDVKKIHLETACDDFEVGTFSTDSLRLRQVLINLLGNAVKFTPEFGRIEFSIKNKGRQAGKALVEFIVRDSGIGIAREEQAKIFESFEQARSRSSRESGGTGLGLAISKHIVELFGGTLKVESELGEGSKFFFEIWLDETEADEYKEKAYEADVRGKFTGKRVLLTDDVAINRIVVSAMLENTGIEIDEAEDGLDALEKFKASPVGYYDIVLMDIQMPKLDGYGASEAIRALDRADAKTVPIVAQTANAFKEDIEKALSHGMSGHIAKPVEMDTLFDVLCRLLKIK